MNIIIGVLFMASIGVVNAEVPKTQDADKTQVRPKKFFFGVFFDGTSNNMIQKEDAKKFKNNSSNSDDWESELINIEDDSFKDGANQPYVEGKKYSNVAILHSIYQGMSDEFLKKAKQEADVFIYNIYVEGAGTEAIYSSEWYEKAYNWKGSISGRGASGVVKLVAKAIHLILTRLGHLSKTEIGVTEVHFDVFGFSRGATCARLFSYLAVRGKNDRLGCEKELEDSMGKSYLDLLNFNSNSKLNRTVDFLGIYDTVSSIGGVTTESYANNVTDYGLFSPTLDKVKSTYHLCAIDEYRSHFALTDIGDAANTNDNAEILIPGCHSDVGGGYLAGEENNFSLTNSLLGNPLFFAMDCVDKPSSIKKPFNGDTFKMMGWCDSYRESGDSLGVVRWMNTNDSLNDSLGLISKVNIQRSVPGVYGNIPLKMMWKRANEKNDRRPFKETIPLRYKIDEDLFGKWSQELLAFAEKKTKGRHCYYPGGSFTSESYKNLRKFLHFSAKDAIGHEPSYDKNTFCRFLYRGNKDDNNRLFLYQINS